MLMKTPSKPSKLRARDLQPVDESLNQRDTLKSVKRFLEDLLGEGAATSDPRRLYIGVCNAIGESPKLELTEG